MSSDWLHFRETYPGRLMMLVSGGVTLALSIGQQGPKTWPSWPFAIIGLGVGAGWSLLAWRRAEAPTSGWRPSPLHGIGLLFAGAVLLFLTEGGPLLRPTGFAVWGVLFAGALLMPPRVFRTAAELRDEIKHRRGEKP